MEKDELLSSIGGIFPTVEGQESSPESQASLKMVTAIVCID